MNDTVSLSQVTERRSTRITARPALLAEALGDDMQVDSDYEQNTTESSSRGKKRKSREDRVNPQLKKFRGKRGLLKQLVEMPLDVLFEVCSTLYLEKGLVFTISSDIWSPESSWPVASSSNHKGSTCYTHETIFDFNLETCPFSVWQFTWLPGWFEWTSVCRTCFWESLYRQFLFFLFRVHFSLIPLSIATGALRLTLSFGTLELGPAPNAYL